MNTRCCFTYLLFFLVFVICSCDKVINDNDDHKQDSTFVSIDQAQESLLSFMANIGLDTKANERVISERYSVGGLVETKSKEDESPLVYVFNFSNNQGYALVSGDTRTPSILCLIESGHFSKEEQETNVGLKMLLTNIDTYCRMLQGFPIENSDGKKLYYHDYKDSLPDYNFGQRDGDVYTLSYYGSILDCVWGQGYPFNVCCFTQSGAHALAGCVPIAVAQIMYYWKNNCTYDDYYYNWDVMDDVVHFFSHPSDTTAWPSVQHLIRAVGNPENLNVTYGTDVSTAPISNIARTFENFGYASGGSFETYTSSFLELSIQNGPILMCGYSHKRETYNSSGNIVNTYYYNGHAWVVDQMVIAAKVLTPEEIEAGVLYPLQRYLHVNWGWDGYQNGYFLSPYFDSNSPLGLPQTRYQTINYGTSGYYKYLLTMNRYIYP